MGQLTICVVFLHVFYLFTCCHMTMRDFSYKYKTHRKGKKLRIHYLLRFSLPLTVQLVSLISASVASGAWNDDAGTRTFDEPVTVDELIIAPS